MKLFGWGKKKEIKSEETTEETLNDESELEQDEDISSEQVEDDVFSEQTEEILYEQSADEESAQEETGEQELEQSDDDTLASDEPKKKSFFSKLFAGLDKTRKSIAESVNQVFSVFTKVDDELFDELEEVLIMADIGVETTTKLITTLKERAKKERVTEVSGIRTMLIEEITKILESEQDEFKIVSPTVLLIIGVNGVGKTTTIGKLAASYKAAGKKVTVAAADTFRAAAIDQLEVWCKRSNIDMIKHQENSDPAAVIFDAVQSAKSKKSDILICDTAGRMHNKKNLMEELRKIFRVISREYPNANKEVFLVLDSTTGQNAFQQAQTFNDIAEITGIVLTKLDGTAKGGIIISIKSELNIPVRYIGVGEGIEDLQPFNAKEFSRALFDTNE